MAAFNHFFSAVLLLLFYSCNNSSSAPTTQFPKSHISVSEFQSIYNHKPQMHIDTAEALLGIRGKLFSSDITWKYYGYQDRDGISFYLIVSDSLVEGSMY
jgi:hypothetical protein